MTDTPDYNNGLPHLWHGGECPVHPKGEVRYWMRRPCVALSRRAGLLQWQHENCDGDILAFRVIKPYREPREGWVVGVWKTSEEARRITGAEPFRVREIMEGEE